MSFSEFELKRIDKLIGTFCWNRVPERARDQLRYSYRVEGQNVIVSEERNRRGKQEEWVALDIARFRYVKSTRRWKLYWMRISGKWQLYEPCNEDKNLETLIEAIGKDTYGCFFG